MVASVSMSMPQEKGWLEHRIGTFIKGSFSGGVSALILQPLDVVKTRQQGFSVHDSSFIKNIRIRDAAGEVWKQDGIAGFWRGIAPSMVRASVGPGIYFLILDIAQKGRKQNENHKSRVFCEGVAARCIAATILCPVSVVKTRFEYSRAQRNNGIIETLRNIAKEERLRGLFRGLVPTLVRDVPASGIYLLLYQGVLQPWSVERFGSSINAPVLNLSSAMIAGIVASVITHPVDVLKTHLQLNNQTVREGIRTIWFARGINGLFTGVTSRLIRRPMSLAITWTTYEIVKKYGEH